MQVFDLMSWFTQKVYLHQSVLQKEYIIKERNLITKSIFI